MKACICCGLDGIVADCPTCPACGEASWAEVALAPRPVAAPVVSDEPTGLPPVVEAEEESAPKKKASKKSAKKSRKKASE